MLHFKLKGTTSEGVPLVLLHGFLESLTMWEVLKLHEKHPTLAIDLPGHGQSSFKPSDSMSMASMAELSQQVINSQNFGKYWAIGHSMGGYVALELAEMDENCEGIILLNSNIWADSPQKRIDRLRVAELVLNKKEMFIREAIPNLFENPDNYVPVVENLIQEAKKMSRHAIAASSIAMSERQDFTLKMNRGEVRPFIVQGKNDRIADYQEMKIVMSTKQDYFFVVDSGHMAHIEATEKIKEILSEILNKKNPDDLNHRD